MTRSSAHPPAESQRLGPVSMIVLGLLAEHGEGTSYDVKRWVERSIGYFWTFPHSQLYAEPQRLTKLGLLIEQQLSSGQLQFSGVQDEEFINWQTIRLDRNEE